MSDEIKRDQPSARRRRLLGVLGGLGLLGLSLPWRRSSASRREPQREKSLREADLYRPHDLAG
jgi:hypothetical protein